MVQQFSKNVRVYYENKGNYLADLWDLYVLKSRVGYKIYSGRNDLGYWLKIN